MVNKPPKKPTVDERATKIATAMLDAFLNALNKKIQNRPDLWTKVLIVANVFLALFTLGSLLLTCSMVSEMKKQNELARQNLQENLRPHLLMKLDSMRFHRSAYGGQPTNTFSAQVIIQNNGNIAAELEFTSIDAFPFSRVQANARDSLLKLPLDSTSLHEDSGTLSKFVPPHSSISFTVVIQDISGRIKPDGVFFIHYIILFSDAFGVLRDVYSVTKCEIDFTNRSLSSYPSSYSYHDYTVAEKDLLFGKSKSVVGY